VLTAAATYDELQTLLAFIRLLADGDDDNSIIDEESIIGNERLNAILVTTAVSQSSTSRIMRALNQAVVRGALTRTSVVTSNRQFIQYQLGASPTPTPGPQDHETDALEGKASASTPAGNKQAASVYAAYEDNIGMLSPLVADQIRLALELYPAFWIHEAINEAVAYNRRQWRYVQRTLQNWSADGRIPGPANEVHHATNKRGPARAIDTD
jgi:DnaD/phage-associated family protein